MKSRDTKHLISISELKNSEIDEILNRAKKYKNNEVTQSLKGRLIISIFFENSTRTLSSFEIAAKHLGGNNVRLDVSKSSTKKGETISDTASNLNAMNPDAIIVRHKSAGACKFLANMVSCPIINAGDGAYSHPTQALLDLLTLQENLKKLSGKKIAIVGDIKNSRVANSNIELLGRYGMEVILVSPPHFSRIGKLESTSDLKSVVDKVDALMSLRTQTERHENQIYASLKDYAHRYCITKELIGDRDIIILHPGPVHRNIDIDDEVLKDSRCKVLEQVSNGVFVRMAVLDYLINSKE